MARIPASAVRGPAQSMCLPMPVMVSLPDAFQVHFRKTSPRPQTRLKVSYPFFLSPTSRHIPHRLSEASKMLRRLEKGLNAAKLKQLNEASTSPVYPTADSRSPQGDPPFGGGLQSHDQYGSSGVFVLLITCLDCKPCISYRQSPVRWRR